MLTNYKNLEETTNIIVRQNLERLNCVNKIDSDTHNKIKVYLKEYLELLLKSTIKTTKKFKRKTIKVIDIYTSLKELNLNLPEKYNKEIISPPEYEINISFYKLLREIIQKYNYNLRFFNHYKEYQCYLFNYWLKIISNKY